MLKQATIATCICASTILAADNLINLSVGPTWPEAKMIKQSDLKTMWNFSGSWGKVFDKRIIVGAKADLGWHVIRYQGTFAGIDPVTLDTLYSKSDNIYRKTRVFMIPLCGWVAIDPIPQYRFHPVVNAQVGYNSLFWSESNYDDGTGVRKDDDFRYYNGFYSKFGIDGMFDLGKQASVFAGFEYQVAPLYYRKDRKLEQISFNAPALRLGVSFLY